MQAFYRAFGLYRLSAFVLRPPFKHCSRACGTVGSDGPDESSRSNGWEREEKNVDMDDLEPRKPIRVKINLDEMSIDALNDYVQNLQDEITRAQKAIVEKEKARAGAESVFKK